MYYDSKTKRTTQSVISNKSKSQTLLWYGVATLKDNLHFCDGSINGGKSSLRDHNFFNKTEKNYILLMLKKAWLRKTRARVLD